MLLVVALLLLPSLCWAQDSTSCFGASFQTIASQIQYTAQFTNTSCDLSRTNVTRLFMLGACSKQHQNNFGDQPPPCRPGDWNVLDTSATTCQQVFANAFPSDIRHPVGTNIFDAGQICNDGYQGIIFVETDCPSLAASSVQLRQRVSSELCWDGHTLAKGALVGIILAGMAGTCLLAGIPVLVCTILWRRRRKQLVEAREMVHSGLNSKSVTSSCEVIKVSESVFVSQPAGQKAAVDVEALLEHSCAYEVEFESHEDESIPMGRGIPVDSVERM